MKWFASHLHLSNDFHKLQENWREEIVWPPTIIWILSRDTAKIFPIKKASHKHDEANPMGNNATIQKFWQKDTDAEIRGFKHILAAK